LAKEITMAVQISLAPLEAGDRLDRAEFHRRYLASPRIKHAELVEGIVYLSSPLRLGAHAEPHLQAGTWLGLYAAMTPGVIAADNPTLILDARNELQPDLVLRIHEECGGRSRQSPKDYLEGAPELIVEIAASSASYDLHDKRDVYARHGVQEYLVWRTRDGAVDWWGLEGGQYLPLPRDSAGRIDSRVMPGLRLEVPALLAGDLAAVLATQQAQHGGPMHSAFATRLARR
jgi:Uma2 family endonuclease